MTFDEAVAVRTMWGEARGEPEEGQRAVAHVLLNRLRAKRWGVTMAGVCLAPLQFSCWNASDPNRKLIAALPDDDPTLVKFVKMLSQAAIGVDPTGGALHYYAKSMAKPPYWASSMTETARIGNHIFLREK